MSGMTAVTEARERARTLNGQFGAQERTAPELTLTGVPATVPMWGTWDDTNGVYLIDVTRVGLTPATLSEQARASAILDDWLGGDRELDPPAEVPITAITHSFQSDLRRDALLWYLETDREHEDTFDDQVSFYGADGPLGIRRPDGTVAVLDGNHRLAAAKLRGKATFRMQLLGAPARLY